MALPLADVGCVRPGGCSTLLPLLGLPSCGAVGRQLPETRRFEVPHPDVPMRRPRAAASGSSPCRRFLLNLFKDPASQLLNEFLRDERGFSAAADQPVQRGHQPPRASSGWSSAGTSPTVRADGASAPWPCSAGPGSPSSQMFAAGWRMWGLSLVASVIGAAAIPALGVYGPELFPTSLRGKANGVIAVVGVCGTMVGLVTAGYRQRPLGRPWRLPLPLLSIGPLAMAGLVVFFYPETAKVSSRTSTPRTRCRSASAAGVEPTR